MKNALFFSPASSRVVEKNAELGFVSLRVLDGESNDVLVVQVVPFQVLDDQPTHVIVPLILE